MKIAGVVVLSVISTVVILTLHNYPLWSKSSNVSSFPANSIQQLIISCANTTTAQEHQEEPSAASVRPTVFPSFEEDFHVHQQLPIREDLSSLISVSETQSAHLSMTVITNNSQVTDDDESAKMRSQVCIMTVSRNHKSFGCEVGSAIDGLTSYLRLIDNIYYPRHKLSLALMTQSEDDYREMKEVFLHRFEQLGFRMVKLLFRNDSFYEISSGIPSKRSPSIQGQRRREIARQRNFLLSSALEPFHDAVLWIDADMSFVPSGTLARMEASGKDIITTLTVNAHHVLFDLNSWVGPRKLPSPEQLQNIARGVYSGFVPSMTEETKFLSHFEEGPEALVELDSVGGTVLFVRAVVHREGVNFPTQFIVGTTWEAEGYDGIETEGLCYLAKPLGYKCWGMPFDRAIHPAC